ncbi:MAG: DUF3488 and transglutaminase-like domain-containing protein [Pseudolysinimonas sp.]|uniref:transglutaminase family protein n=1 Tax=Pseudolysinimonas sp. TaxID=2680009 RepID=UPI00326468A1
MVDTRIAPPPSRAVATPKPGAAKGTLSTTARPEVRPTIIRLVLFAVALIASIAGLSKIFDGTTWLVTMVSFAVLPIAAAAAAVVFSRRAWLPAVAAVVVAVASLTFTFARDDAVLGFIPTPQVVATWGDLAQGGAEAIANQSVPAITVDGLLFLLGGLAAACAIIGVLVIDVGRMPAAVAFPLATILAIPVMIRSDLALPLAYIVAVIAFLALLRVGRRPAGRAAVVATAAVVIAGSLILPTITPQADEVARTGGVFGSGTPSVNPFIDLGADLRRAKPVEVLTYSTNAPGGAYLRLATLDDFQGNDWEPATEPWVPSDSVDKFPALPGLASTIITNSYTVDVQVQNLAGRWLPTPYGTSSIKGLSGDWSWEPDSLAVRTRTGTVSGESYASAFVVPQPNLDQLRDATPDGTDPKYLVLPSFMPASIGEIAQQVTSSATTPWQKALALQDYFTSGDFVYSEESPVQGHYDGNGMQAIERFLQEKSGYCVHYASAMAVMARTLGIPSRIAIGFQPGEPVVPDAGESPAPSTEGMTNYTVSSDDLHAWPELYFSGIGWLRFEPTPGRGFLPTYSTVAGVDDPTTPQVEGPQPAPTGVANPGTGPSIAPDDPTDPGTVVQTEAVNPLPIAMLMLLFILLVLLTPAIIRFVIRSRRFAAMTTGRDAAAAAWDEVRDTARDHEWSAPDSETPRQLGRRLEIIVGEGTVSRLRLGVEQSAYDRPGSGAMTVDDVREVRHAIAVAASSGVRLRAVFLPPSLLDRVGITFRRRPDSAG